MTRVFCIILFAILILPAFVSSQEIDQNKKSVLASENGRFVFGQISESRRDQYLLDTKTGRLWQIVVDSLERYKLQPTPFISLVTGGECYLPESEEVTQRVDSVLYQFQLDSIKKINAKSVPSDTGLKKR